MSLTAVMSGGLFGSALLYSGMSSPSTMQAQLSLTDSHMMQTLLVASAISAFIAYFRPTPPRTPSPFSRYFPYSANIFGGILQGVGMALSGACPGTGLVQLGSALPSGLYFVLGGLVGALVFIILSPALQVREDQKPAFKATGVTISDHLGMTNGAMLALWETLCCSVVFALGSSNSGAGWWQQRPIAGGLAIGAAQLACVLLRGSMVGVSGGYAQLIEWVMAVVRGKQTRPVTGAAQFSAGIAVGSWLVSLILPDLVLGLRGDVQVTKQAAVLGGALQIFGSRLAGGCTSGHGISGIATFGTASFLTVASIFVGGIAWTIAQARAMGSS